MTIDTQKIREYITGIREKKNEINEKLIRARNNHNKIIKDCSIELEELQKRCPHVNITFHGDASGNNDSHDECLDCGKEARNL